MPESGALKKMRLELTGRHVDVTPVLRRLVDTKLAKLERLLNDRAVSAHAVMTREKNGYRVDVTLHARGEKFLHGMAKTASWEASLGEVVGKISEQAQKIKTKWQDRQRHAPKAGMVVAETVVDEKLARAAERVARSSRPTRVRMPRILRVARQPVKPMSVADAARQVEANGEGVVVFRDTDTQAVSVLYRRANGELTLVETEA
jgi:putative sigma-54 modulation protein